MQGGEATGSQGQVKLREKGPQGPGSKLCPGAPEHPTLAARILLMHSLCLDLNSQSRFLPNASNRDQLKHPKGNIQGAHAQPLSRMGSPEPREPICPAQEDVVVQLQHWVEQGNKRCSPELEAQGGVLI